MFGVAGPGRSLRIGSSSPFPDFQRQPILQKLIPLGAPGDAIVRASCMVLMISPSIVSLRRQPAMGSVGSLNTRRARSEPTGRTSSPAQDHFFAQPDGACLLPDSAAAVSRRPWRRAAGERTCEEARQRINVCLLARHPETKAGFGFSPKASAFESVARGLGTGFRRENRPASHAFCAILPCRPVKTSPQFGFFRPNFSIVRREMRCACIGTRRCVRNWAFIRRNAAMGISPGLVENDERGPFNAGWRGSWPAALRCDWYCDSKSRAARATCSISACARPDR